MAYVSINRHEQTPMGQQRSPCLLDKQTQLFSFLTARNLASLDPCLAAPAFPLWGTSNFSKIRYVFSQWDRPHTVYIPFCEIYEPWVLTSEPLPEGSHGPFLVSRVIPMHTLPHPALHWVKGNHLSISGP